LELSQWIHYAQQIHPNKKRKPITDVAEDARKEKHLHTVGGNVNYSSHHEVSTEVLQNLKSELPYDPAVLTHKYTKRDQSAYYRDPCTPMYIAALFTID
jgi:hypothetical protein